MTSTSGTTKSTSTVAMAVSCTMAGSGTKLGQHVKQQKKSVRTGIDSCAWLYGYERKAAICGAEAQSGHVH